MSKPVLVNIYLDALLKHSPRRSLPGMRHRRMQECADHRSDTLQE